ncbi:(d)CMP kinase [Jatrophihabitans fulvus]
MTERYTGVVALDGPSGTGKSTVARRLAQRLGARYLDTGAMYRAATVAALRAGVPLDDAVAIAQVVEAARIDISTDPQQASVRLDGDAVDTEIRSGETTAAVSAVSAVPSVRAQLVAQQRELIDDGGIVVEGRDIGSVVWPTARPKVYLTASPEVRAQRRAKELDADVEAIAGDIARRDGLDSSRAASPLAQAADAVELDTSELDIDQVVDRLVDLATGSS